MKTELSAHLMNDLSANKIKPPSTSLGALLYELNTSNSAINRTISKIGMRVASAVAKDAVLGHSKELESQERESLTAFLGNIATKKMLESIGVNPKAFAAIALDIFPYGTSKLGAFERAIVVFRNEVRERSPLVINKTKLRDIISRIALFKQTDFESGTRVTRDSDFIDPDSQAGGASLRGRQRRACQL